MKHQPLITKITNYTGSCLRLDTRPGFDFITAQPNKTTTVTGDVFTMLDDRTAENIIKIKPESILFEYYVWKGDQYVFAGTPQNVKQEVSVKAEVKDTAPGKPAAETAPVSTPKEEPKAEPVVTITEEPQEEAPAETISNDEFFTSTIDSSDEDAPKKTRKKGTRK